MAQYDEFVRAAEAAERISNRGIKITIEVVTKGVRVSANNGYDSSSRTIGWEELRRMGEVELCSAVFAVSACIVDREKEVSL